jgi:hypothetical protein
MSHENRGRDAEVNGQELQHLMAAIRCQPAEIRIRRMFVNSILIDTWNSARYFDCTPSHGYDDKHDMPLLKLGATYRPRISLRSDCGASLYGVEWVKRIVQQSQHRAPY